VIPVPVGDENPTSRPAVVNYTLIAANGLVFLWLNVIRGEGFFEISEADLRRFALLPGEPTPQRFFASMFMHATPWHLLGNMWFLHIFGDNVEDKVGRAPYLLLYLLWGVLASLAFLAFGRPLGEIAGVAAQETARRWAALPMVGASGAIAGVMGAYLVFFPRARIRMIWWMILLIVPLSLPAIVVIGMYFVQDLVLAAWNLGRPLSGGTAYAAHTGGMVAGIVVALVAKPFLPRGKDPAWERDTGFARGDASKEEGAPGGGWGGRQAAPRADLRDAIVGAVLDGRMDLALDLHGRRSGGEARESLPPRVALEIGHELMRRGRVDEAAEEYRRFLGDHGEAGDAPEAHFRLGLIHARATGDLAAAREHLRRAAAAHRDPATRATARRELDRL